MIKITNKDIIIALMAANRYGLSNHRIVNIDIKAKAWHGTNESSHDCVIEIEPVVSNR
ncbi:MAG: hypothetical protein H8D45_28515 [Bacteroidetes bacterium]|nr:hypothetical protein [Bacteroidota bacterium]